MKTLISLDSTEAMLTDDFMEHMNAHQDVLLEYIQSFLDKVSIKEIPINKVGSKYVNINILLYKGRSALVYDTICYGYFYHFDDIY